MGFPVLRIGSGRWGWRRRLVVLAGVLTVAAGAGCGKKGVPRPPEPRGPLPPRAVETRQIGPALIAAFDAPEPRGPKPAEAPTRAELIRVGYPPGVEAPADPDAFRRRGVVVALMEGSPLTSGARLTLADPTWQQLSGGGVGWTLRYGIRVRDRRGRPSPLVVAPDLVPVETPPRPQELSAEPTSDGIRLVWARPATEGTFRYDVYRAGESETFGERPLNGQPLTSLEYLDGSVEIGKTYRYEVRTVIGDPPPYRESAGGGPVTLVAEDRFAPAVPTGLVAVQEGAAVRLFWDPGTERDVSGYRVYRRVQSSSWERIGPNPVIEPLFLDAAVSPGQRLTYRVTAVDRSTPPNESPPSETVELVVAEEAGDPVPDARQGEP
jgi:hypothetical protein